MKFDITEAKRSGFTMTGGKGSGKTTAAMELAQKLMDEGMAVYVFDNSQAWPTRSSIPNVVSVQFPLHLDFPYGDSVIFDLSTLYVEEQRRFVTEFCKNIFRQQVSLPKEKRKWIFLLFEEAQIYLQQGSMRSKSYAEVMRLVTVGRNFNIGCGFITQFPSTIDKLVVKSTQQRYFGKTSEKNDKTYIESFLGRETTEDLQKLTVGEFMYNYSGVTEKIQFEDFKSPIVPKPLAMPTPKTQTNDTTVKTVHMGDVLTTEQETVVGIILIVIIVAFAIYVWTNTNTHYVQSVFQPLLAQLSRILP